MCDLKPNAKYQKPTITPYGRKVNVAERKKEERDKNAVNSGHLVPWQCKQAAQTQYKILCVKRKTPPPFEHIRDLLQITLEKKSQIWLGVQVFTIYFRVYGNILKKKLIKIVSPRLFLCSLAKHQLAKIWEDLVRVKIQMTLFDDHPIIFVLSLSY